MNCREKIRKYLRGKREKRDEQKGAGERTRGEETRTGVPQGAVAPRLRAS